MAVIDLGLAKKWIKVEHDEDNDIIQAMLAVAVEKAQNLASQKFGEQADEEAGISVPTELQKAGILMILTRLYENPGAEDFPQSFSDLLCNYFLRPDGRVPV